MANIFKIVKKVINKIVEIMGVEEDTTELDCIKCKKVLGDSEYIYFCQTCGDDVSEVLGLIDTEITDEDLDMANLHRWRG